MSAGASGGQGCWISLQLELHTAEPPATSARKERNVGPLLEQHTTQPSLQPLLEESGSFVFVFSLDAQLFVCCFVFV